MVQTVRTIVEIGAGVNRLGSDGCTPLMHAAKAGNVDGVACLVELGALSDYETPAHKTALIAATLAGAVPAIAALCAVGRGPIRSSFHATTF